MGLFDNLTLTVGLLIGLTVLISLRAFNDPQLRARLLFHPASVKNRGEWDRFITHGFIHGDGGHLFFNMWGLLIFGPAAEEIFTTIIFQSELVGRLAFLAFYLISIAAASLPTYFRHQDHMGYSALGASGAVAAIMWPFIMYDPWNWFIFPPLPAFIIGIGYIVYSSYMDKRGNSRIGHNAHLWGAVFGLVVYVSILLLLGDSTYEYGYANPLDVFIERIQQPRGPSF
ncbi:MAG: rhomboid family intramembrane serine protease [Bacteroidota bacterium]